MKKIITLLFFVFLYHFAFSQWKQLDSIPVPRSDAASFSIGDTGYIVAGGNSWFLYDAWTYDTLTNAWSQIQNFPNTTNDEGQVGFSINGIGYVGTGAYIGYSWTNSFYEYTPSAGQWTSIASFPGVARAGAVAFVIGDKAYVGGGHDGPTGGNPLNDFYVYNASTGTWGGPIAPCPAAGVGSHAVAFAINGEGYVGTGDTISGSSYIPEKDFWKYNPDSDKWTRVADFGGGVRADAAGFAICDKGYVGTGNPDVAQNEFTKDFWQYDPVKNKWTRIADYGGTARAYTRAFVIGKTAYVGTGRNASSTSGLGALWSYTPIDTPAFSADTSICSGGSITFTDTSNYSPTNWYWQFPGGTPDTSTKQYPTVEYDTVGTHNVILTAWNGCDSGTKTFTNYITVTTSSPFTILPNDTGFCSGQKAILHVSGGGSNFIWTPGAGIIDSTLSRDSITVSPTATTTYTVIGINKFGCATSGTDVVSIVLSPNKPSFTQNVDTLISSSQYDNQWYRNDTLLVGDTSQNLTITIPGEYWVVVNNEANGCNTSSDSMSVKLAGINQLSINSDQLSIYPNPFNNDIFIKINSLAENVKDWTLQITDVLGRTLYVKLSLNYDNEIDLSNLSGGVYFIIVINKTGRAVFPVVKQN